MVPIRNKYVCGLNVPWNLAIIETSENRVKSNDWWPDCPWDTPDMFGARDPHQMRLL